MQMTARIRWVHLPVIIYAGLGTYPDWGLPQRHRVIPSLLLMKDNVLLMVYITIRRIHCQGLLPFLRIFDLML